MIETSENNNTPQELGADGSLAGVELEEIGPYPFDAEKISISDKRVPLQTLIRRLEQGTISAPPIQRGAGIWGDEQQSRLIESLMLRIPVPLFYVAEDEDINWKVVDGLQRVTAIARYILRKEFALSGLEFLQEFEGFRFDDLPQRFQNRILETEFQFAIINPSTPQNVQRNVFKRLNTGGLPLTAQEIRHALYYGSSAELLAELAKSNEFVKATDGRVDDSRMAGRELVLRFLSFLIRGVESYPKNEDMDAFLSGTMQLINLMPEFSKKEMEKIFGEETKNLQIKYRVHDQLKKHFFIAMNRAFELFGDRAFRKSVPTSGRSRTPINKALFETWSVLLSEMDDYTYNSLWRHRKRLYKLLDAAIYHTPKYDLEKYISRDSHKYQGVIKRYNIFNNITKIALRDDNVGEAISIIYTDPSLDDALTKILNNDNIPNAENNDD